MNYLVQKVFEYVEYNWVDIQLWCIETNYKCYDPFAANVIEDLLEGFLAKGYTELDAYNMCILNEAIDPRIPEAVALRRMKKISEKYNA